jgi:hypothetical protein
MRSCLALFWFRVRVLVCFLALVVVIFVLLWSGGLDLVVCYNNIMLCSMEGSIFTIITIGLRFRRVVRFRWASKSKAVCTSLPVLVQTVRVCTIEVEVELYY